MSMALVASAGSGGRFSPRRAPYPLFTAPPFDPAFLRADICRDEFRALVDKELRAQIDRIDDQLRDLGVEPGQISVLERSPAAERQSPGNRALISTENELDGLRYRFALSSDFDLSQFWVHVRSRRDCHFHAPV